jgi:hypothetical protein
MSHQKIGYRSIIGVDGGQWGSMCTLYFIPSDLVGDNIRRAG